MMCAVEARLAAGELITDVEVYVMQKRLALDSCVERVNAVSTEGKRWHDLAMECNRIVGEQAGVEMGD